jgi:hypothetical protein
LKDFPGRKKTFATGFNRVFLLGVPDNDLLTSVVDEVGPLRGRKIGLDVLVSQSVVFALWRVQN